MSAAVRVVATETEYEAGRRVGMGAGDRPVDFAHLARQTSGNRQLEREVLRLFVHQTDTHLARLLAGDNAAVHAHSIKGSASGIGAWRVMRAAGAVEDAARLGRAQGGAFDALTNAVAEANAFIEQILAAN